jgi:hypothetical protein
MKENEDRIKFIAYFILYILCGILLIWIYLAKEYEKIKVNINNIGIKNAYYMNDVYIFTKD